MNAHFEKNPTSPELEQWVHTLYDGALIAEGRMVADPLAYSKRVYDMMIKVSAV